MNTPDFSPLAALELQRLWSARDNTPWPSQTTGPDGERLFVFEHRSTIPLLIENPVAACNVDAELAWRVAFDVIAVKIKLRGQIAAFLRPLLIGEADHLHRGNLLRCDQPEFADRRDAVMESMMHGRRTHIILQRKDMLLALLSPLPPLGAQPLSAATEAELTLLRRLRSSRISREELLLLMGVWDEQQERATGGASSDEELPVVRIISEAEDKMLRLLRQAAIRTREELVTRLSGGSRMGRRDCPEPRQATCLESPR